MTHTCKNCGFNEFAAAVKAAKDAVSHLSDQEEWIDDEDGERVRALAEIAAICLRVGFIWTDTEEGSTYWNDVHTKLCWLADGGS
jgi:hypothetical protein